MTIDTACLLCGLIGLAAGIILGALITLCTIENFVVRCMRKFERSNNNGKT